MWIGVEIEGGYSVGLEGLVDDIGVVVGVRWIEIRVNERINFIVVGEM